jgi:hypothetical protein
MREALWSFAASVTTIWGFLALVCVAVVTLILGLKVNRFRELLKRIDHLSEEERLTAVKIEFNHIPPPRMTAEQYIRIRLYPYHFAFKCVVVLLLTGLIGMLLVTIFPSLLRPPKPIDCLDTAHQLTWSVSSKPILDEERIMTENCRDINLRFETTLPHPVMVQVCFSRTGWCGSPPNNQNEWVTFQTHRFWQAVATNVKSTTRFFLIVKSAYPSSAPFPVKVQIAY